MGILNFFVKKKIRLADFILDYCNTSKRSAAHIRFYRCLAGKIEQFEKHIQKEIYTDSFDERTLEEYIHFLKSYQLDTIACAYKQTTIRNYYQKTLAAVNKAGRQGWPVKTSAFRECSVKEEDAGAVFLTLKELEAINSLELRKEAMRVRDIFLIGCYTGLRFSDYSRLSAANFLSGNITILTKKTDVKVTIPIHPVIQSIIDRNGGYGFLGYEKSLQNFNDVIRRICKRAGIINDIHLEYTRGCDKVQKVAKKYELISSHTARRTAATNMYLAGIPVFRIMLITGHKSESAFYKYIRIRKEENAKELQNHAFFLGKS